jgi:hypothetical protein
MHFYAGPDFKYYSSFMFCYIPVADGFTDSCHLRLHDKRMSVHEIGAKRKFIRETSCLIILEITFYRRAGV